MKGQRISSTAAQVVYGRAQVRAEMSTLTTGYHQVLGIEDMSYMAMDCHATTELPCDGMRRYSRAALAVLSIQADKKTP